MSELLCHCIVHLYRYSYMASLTCMLLYTVHLYRYSYIYIVHLYRYSYMACLTCMLLSLISSTFSVWLILKMAPKFCASSGSKLLLLMYSSCKFSLNFMAATTECRKWHTFNTSVAGSDYKKPLIIDVNYCQLYWTGYHGNHSSSRRRMCDTHCMLGHPLQDKSRGSGHLISSTPPG